MTDEEFDRLDTGAIIRHKHSSESLVVTANYGNYCIAVRAAHVSNPSEWDVIFPAPSQADVICRLLKRAEAK